MGQPEILSGVPGCPILTLGAHVEYPDITSMYSWLSQISSPGFISTNISAWPYMFPYVDNYTDP